MVLFIISLICIGAPWIFFLVSLIKEGLKSGGIGRHPGLIFLKMLIITTLVMGCRISIRIFGIEFLAWIAVGSALIAAFIMTTWCKSVWENHGFGRKVLIMIILAAALFASAIIITVDSV